MRTNASTRLTCGKNLVLIAMVGLFALAMSACGDESISGGEAAAFSADPPTLSFPQVNLNESLARTVTLRNTGSGTLVLTEIGIHDNGGRSSDAFERTGDWPTRIELESEDAITLTVTFTPTQTIEYGGMLRMNTNIPDLPQAEIPIVTQGLSPEVFSPQTINFARTPAGTSEWTMTRIENIGAAPLQINHIVVENGAEFEISFPAGLTADGNYPPIEEDTQDYPGTLNPGDDPILMRVTYNPQTDNPSSDRIIISSNDPLNSDYTVDLSGNSGAACLEVAQRDGVDFGLATIGNTTYRTVTMKNCAPGTELTISDIAISDTAGGAFSIRQNSYPGNLPDEPVVLQPSEIATVVVGYQPAGENTDAGELMIRSTDGATPNLAIPLSGQGTTRQCPIAQARGQIAGTTQWNQQVLTNPLDDVKLSSQGSNDPDGGALSYEWSIVNRPSGSNSQLQPSATAENPDFWVDVAGVYQIELTVYNDIGMASCETSVVEINSLPAGDIHVELTWNSPAYPNPVNGSGTDLDLHYLHQNGVWGDLQQSVSYRRKTHSWDGGQVSLDIDSLWGETPENVNHNNPKLGYNYNVGIHYYSDYGNGVSDATVRVYFGQQLVYEKLNRRVVNVNDLWRVGVIQWNETPSFYELDTVITNHGLGGF